MTTKDDTWMLWPDDFMIPLEEYSVNEYGHRGDDYILVEVLEYDEHLQPVQYRFYKA